MNSRPQWDSKPGPLNKAPSRLQYMTNFSFTLFYVIITGFTVLWTDGVYSNGHYRWGEDGTPLVENFENWWGGSPSALQNDRVVIFNTANDNTHQVPHGQWVDYNDIPEEPFGFICEPVRKYLLFSTLSFDWVEC